MLLQLVGYAALSAVVPHSDFTTVVEPLQRLPAVLLVLVALMAGEIAENREADLIERDHVEAARSRLEQERVEEGMRELTTHGRLALLAVISKAAKEETPCRTREIYE